MAEVYLLKEESFGDRYPHAANMPCSLNHILVGIRWQLTAF